MYIDSCERSKASPKVSTLGSNPLTFVLIFAHYFSIGFKLVECEEDIKFYNWQLLQVPSKHIGKKNFPLNKVKIALYLEKRYPGRSPMIFLPLSDCFDLKR